MAYISASDVGLFMNATRNESGEAYLDALISQIEAAVEATCNRARDATAPQTGTFDGGVTRLFPRSTPISSVGALTVNGTTPEAEPGILRHAGLYPAVLQGFQRHSKR
jgi:hypothetical protein